MMGVDPSTLALEFLAGAAIGGCLGIATKRIAKPLAIVVGVQLVVFRYLESRGIVIVDWNRLTGGLVNAGESATAVDVHWISALLSTLAIGAGFTSGFLIGFHRG